MIHLTIRLHKSSVKSLDSVNTMGVRELIEWTGFKKNKKKSRPNHALKKVLCYNQLVLHCSPIQQLGHKYYCTNHLDPQSMLSLQLTMMNSCHFIVYSYYDLIWINCTVIIIKKKRYLTLKWMCGNTERENWK